MDTLKPKLIEIIQFKILPYNMKYCVLNLTKHIQDQYTENHKTWM